MSPRTVTELVTLASSDSEIEYLHFWGHKAQPDGSIGAGCLSQWWPAEFSVSGHSFATAEHYMMWRKAMLFEDNSMAEQILTAGSPRQAKALGRKVAGFEQDVWESHRYAIVVEGNVAKFSQHDDLRAYLLATGDQVLVEASPRDRVWGIGLGSADPRASDPAQWRGLNLLGFALMETRSRLH